ncbi:DUF4914 family protein [Anaerobium acetethylicum]|uniref:DUF4914 domain-containing protein n=1 Tax=Anaerobium acetethylicum TaxID=1619234 RepID=A0A1D3TTI5_9FIRM|nr:DUF4914 family protein [Anaerobium acetethylicum]SCP97234.1 protein of unknown function [Anaerobium acetethylicum]
MRDVLNRMVLPEAVKKMVGSSNRIIFPETRDELIDIALGGKENDYFEVAYDVPGQEKVVEATVARCKNGLVVNYTDIYLRRRDPDSMVIADNEKTDKQTFVDKYGYEFDSLRDETFEWLENHDLIILPFMAGGSEFGYPMLLVAPANAGFFAAGLADLQGFIPCSQVKEGFKPRAVIYLAPTFRHTHFDGKQMVVHNRLDEVYELFSYNLYPGPSAKKGVYGVLLKIGEEEGWITLHGSTVKIGASGRREVVLMHEGASGGGKSEMTEHLVMDHDGKVKLGINRVTGEGLSIRLKEACSINPVTDDMALCHPKLQNESGKLMVMDAENGWFLRTDHITEYGTAPQLESLCMHPKEPLIFLNYDAVPGSTCLIWDHAMDAPGKPCPNPRVIMPRDRIEGNISEPVAVDIRSFGMRAPVCTKHKPTYGIIGLVHVLPPALAWVWRLVAPRGDNNPSITTRSKALTSEGVGSYWPFATGTKVAQANLLLEQIAGNPNTDYLLIPNQHIGAYRVGFNPQWIVREYLARNEGAVFAEDQLAESGCTLLGYKANYMEIDGSKIPEFMLDVAQQPEVGEEGFQKGAEILIQFFKDELEQYMTPELLPLGRRIVECIRNDGSLEELKSLL